MLEEIKLNIHNDNESVWSAQRLEHVLAPLGFRLLMEPSSIPDTVAVRVSFDPLRLYTYRTRNAGRQKVGTELTKEVYEEYKRKGYSNVQIMTYFGLSKKTFYRRKADFV